MEEMEIEKWRGFEENWKMDWVENSLFVWILENLLVKGDVKLDMACLNKSIADSVAGNRNVKSFYSIHRT